MGGREKPSGSFYDVWNYGNSVSAGSGGVDLRFGMEASKSSSVYSKSSVVQPKTFYTLMIVKC